MSRADGRSGSKGLNVALRTALGSDGEPTVSRKAEHIRINLEEDVSAKGVTAGFERYRFVPCALPEIDLSEVDLSCTLFGRTVQAPLFISSMTGGVPDAERLNLELAAAAQQLGLAIGLGSGRVLLEQPDVLSTFNVRSVAPDVVVMANVGAVQLNR